MLATKADTIERPGWGLEAEDELVPGRHVLGRLGGGHRYEAYLVWDDRLYAVVVVKVVRPHLVEDAHTLSGLEAEIRVLERLNHPVIVRMFDAELEGSRPQVVLEHLEGPRLSSLIRKYGPLPVEQLVPLGIQVCSALHYLAGEGMVHLDVKPSNLIMGAPPRMIDMSVAQSVEDGLHRPVGTDPYMAPEQCEPRRLGPVGSAADVFGLGVTLYRAAAGIRPFSMGDPDSEDPEARWPQVVEDPAPLEGRVPPAIAEPIMACLRRAP
ncbi:MAG TPA: serine/threonine-protein kinase, partial [Thermoleophilaceae bacterium]|nr:serine/threonine-protein kinase [Thermoleophilaceae bacterium]